METLATNLVGDGAVEGIVLNTRDVSERKALERRLMHEASHDTLTGLPNRMLLRDRVEQALARRRRSGAPIAVIFIDLDDFKNVNDTLGHAEGDAVLQEVARRLDGCVRACDTATRLGGDEFAVLVDDLTDESQAVDDRRADPRGARPAAGDRGAHRRAERAASASPSPSTGATRPTTCCRDADAAMYLAKDRGKGSYAIYEPAMHAAAVARLELKVDLARAIADGAITLVYQPVVDLAQRRDPRLRGARALDAPDARRGRPRRCSSRSPSRPASSSRSAATCSARPAVRRPCFHEACAIGEPLRVSVNVSARQLVVRRLRRRRPRGGRAPPGSARAT